MRRVATLALITGGTMAAVTAAAFARGRLRGRGPEAPTSPEEDSQYTLYAPGGPWGFLFNGPVGWACTKYMPIMQAGMYGVVAEILDLQPDDDLLDIGCGPGAFLAKARRARRVVGLDPSQVMLRDAERRLADRLAAGTAQLVLGSSAALPLSDGEFSAVTVISAPVNLAEVFRVLRPGGRFVGVFELVPGPRKPSSEMTAVAVNWNEADTRRMLEDTGFTDLSVRYKDFSFLGSFLGAQRIVSCHKPAASRPNTTVDVGGQHELTGSAASGL